MSDEYTVETIEREGYVGKIVYMESPDMPDFDGDGHILELDYLRRRNRVEVRNVDCMREDEAATLALALWQAVDRWGLDWERIERYLRVFYDVISLDHTSWTRDSCLVAVATRGLARDGWGNPDADPGVHLAPYKAFRDGEVYGYELVGPDGELLDSCYGYYGDEEIEYLRTVINDAIDAELKERHAQRSAMFRRLLAR